MNGTLFHARSLPLLAVLAVSAATAGAQSASGNRELDREIAYIRILSDQLMMPDYAEIVLNNVKNRFPEASAVLKVLQIEQQLAQGKFDEVKAVIAAEKDPESEEVWAMKSTMADYLFAYGRYDEAFGIYEGLHKKYGAKPPKALESFYFNSLYKYAQMLLRIQKPKQAVAIYKILLSLPSDPEDEQAHAIQRQIAFEHAELLINIADAEKDGSKERADYLAQGEKACKAVLWEQDLWFGKGVALLARVRILRGDLDGAQKLVRGYLPTIKAIDDALMEQDPVVGARLSPVAQCRYLTGRMYYEEAKKILDSVGDADVSAEQKGEILKLLLGTKLPNSDRTADAYTELLNVAIQYPAANDAPEAMRLVEEIEDMLTSRKLVKSFKKNITPEQRATIAHSQFENARVSFNQQQWEEAATRYETVLNQYPREIPDSINALSELARCYMGLYDPAKPETAVYAIYADMVVGHLAEAFCNGNGMNTAGDELRRIAEAWATEKGDLPKRDAVFEIFYSLYPDHPMAAPLIWGKADTAYKAQDYATALEAFTRIAEAYRRSPLSKDALVRIASIHKALGDVPAEIAAHEELRSRLEESGKPSSRLLGVLYQIAQARRGLVKPEDLRSDDAEAVAAAQKNLKEAAKGFQAVTKILDDPQQAPLYAVTDDEKKDNAKIHEAACMGIAGCYSALASMNLPEAAVSKLREAAIKAYEDVLAKFPGSDNGARVLNQIGTLWTAAAAKSPDADARKAANDKANNAFERLSRDFPESEEAKLSLFMQGRALIDLGFASEGREKFAQMFRDTSKYTPSQMLSVGEALREGRQADLALQAYEDAEKRSTDNEAVRQRARFGRAMTLAGQKDRVADACQALEAFVQDYPKSALALDANLQLARTASQFAADPSVKDAKERDRLFESAVKAMKEVRKYYNAKMDEIDKRARAGESAEDDAEERVRFSAKLAETDNDIGDILIRQSKAADAAGDKDAAKTSLRRAIAHFISIADSFVPGTPDADARSPHVQKSFRTAVDLMIQAKEFEFAATYAEQYLETFPAGLYAADMRALATEAKAMAGN